MQVIDDDSGILRVRMGPPLVAINDVFTRLLHGEVPSRVVLDFQGT
jgi:hypothetical protein